MKELNGNYLDTNRIKGTTIWYNGSKNLQNGIYDYSKNIKSGALKKVTYSSWNIGRTSSEISVIDSYILERGTKHVSKPLDEVLRMTV